MQNLFHEMEDLLHQNEEYFAQDGSLLRNLVIEEGLKLEPDLLKLLLSNKEIKAHFFSQIGDVLVFDKEKFLQFVNNKEFLPDSYTTFKNKIGLSDDGGQTLISQKRDVELVWPYKDCVLEGGQTKEDAKRDEIFWNSTLAPDDITRLLEPKIFTNWKRIDQDGNHKLHDLHPDDNLIIKGNNLLVLNSISHRFSGLVKLIYIDPPYNTGDDSFKYNDKFAHSTWLTFMKNRLEAAFNLLKSDGYLLIQIDNRELHYLKILCDEIFGRENFRNGIIVKKGTKSLQKQFDTIVQLNAGYDTILLYSKSPDSKMPNLFKRLANNKSSSWNNHWRGTDRPTMRYPLFGVTPTSGQWRWSEERTIQAVQNYEKLLQYINARSADQEINDSVIDEYYWRFIEENGILDNKDFELVRLSEHGKPEHYIPADNEILLSENWMDIPVAGSITNFSHEKNEEILLRIFNWLTQENDIVMDFFLGSGTTAAVAHKMKRQYIGIEQMDYGNNDPVVRLSNVINSENKGISRQVKWHGGGSFVYCELRKWNKSLIEEIKAVKTQSEIHGILSKVISKGHLVYSFDEEEFIKNEQEFNSLNLHDQKNLLLQILEKNDLFISYSEIEDKTYNISSDDLKFNRIFFTKVK